ncbi:MAG TPA: hypothetical protein VGC13_09545 [Longimicrobium sp.]|jgi:hypothetical protein|uniref:hypothetical protein n=1 Tax=Longimicrobium sp. TaxID=2029185 RepID=UPI002EDA044D
MKKMFTLAAILALAACDSATASDRAGAQNARQPRAQETTASLSGGASHRAVIVSVRKRVAGSPGLYEARALAVDGGEVTVEIRSSTTAFNNLTSGTFEVSDTDIGEVNQAFQTTAGTRYLIVAYPSSGGVVDAAHAAYTEAVP